ncbi:KOW motif-containing protein [Evansella tamaricis]|uniref:KOW motif-containing protein n=1 Tax=Evansella tamaricis TaxID=2069301 RepID=A0ABS6JK44_9BACI|nr:KOW motif-containing protein [Evansella tamaricis]MBU9714059.1 KOW motif-containing protein [Evansella tamaricis]
MEEEKGKIDQNTPPPVEIGESVKIIAGPDKGEEAKVIAVYTNSVAVELNKMQKNGTLARTVLTHKEYAKKK